MRRFSPAGQMPVEPGLVDDGSDSRQRRIAPLRDRVSEQGHRARVGVRQTEQYPDQRRLAGAVRSEVAESTSPRHEELDVVHCDVLPESLRQTVRLHGPLGRGRLLVRGVEKGRGAHRAPPPARAGTWSSRSFVKDNLSPWVLGKVFGTRRAHSAVRVPPVVVRRFKRAPIQARPQSGETLSEPRDEGNPR